MKALKAEVKHLNNKQLNKKSLINEVMFSQLIKNVNENISIKEENISI